MPIDGKVVVKRYEKLKTGRFNFEALSQEIGELVLPNGADFTHKYSVGEKRGKQIYDSTAELALDTFASSLLGITANPASKWFSLAVQDEEINRDREARLWLELAEKICLNSFNEAEAKFYTSLKSALQTIGAFGTGGISAYRGKNVRIVYEPETPAQFVIAENADHFVDVFYKLRRFTIEQLLSKGENEGWELTPDITDKKDVDETIEIINCVMPNPDFDPTIRASKRFSSVWVHRDKKKILFESGFNSYPTAIARWDIAGEEIYGRGPAIMARADIRMINTMRKAHIVAAEKIINPPLQMKSDGEYNNPVDLSPAAINIYSDPNGKIEPINTIGNINLTLDMEEQIRNSIRSAFFIDQLQLVETQEMTATEVMQRVDQKARLLAPAIGGLQSELIGPIVTRTLDLLTEGGFIPEPPEILQARDLKVIYNSPITRAQRSQDVQSTILFINHVAEISQFFPSIINKIDENAIVDELHHMIAPPSSILRETKDAEAITQQQREQAQQAQQVALAKDGADAAQKAKKAELI